MVLTLIQIVLALLAVASIGVYLGNAIVTLRFFARSPDRAPRQPPRLDHRPPISLLVPACGLEAEAWRHWSAFCRQDYPTYEVLFGVTDATDPAVPLLRQLVATYPDRARLLVDLPPRGINHKDSNLTYLLERARHNLLVFADADIIVDRRYLDRVTAPLRRTTPPGRPPLGLVTCGYIDRSPRSFGAAIAALGRCCDFIPNVLLARQLGGGMNFAIGKTIAMPRAVLEAIGGLVVNRIGSDRYIGQRVADAGYGVTLSRSVLHLNGGKMSLSAAFRRELRWARTIRSGRGAEYYGMVFCYGSVFGLLLLPVSGWAWWAIVLAAVVWSLRIGQAAIAIDRTRSPGLYRWLWALPLRDAMSAIVWALGAIGRRVYWRGRWLRVGKGGLLTPDP